MSLKERAQEESSKVRNQERETFGRQVGANRQPKVTVTGAGSSTLQQNNGADANNSFPYHEMSRKSVYDYDEYLVSVLRIYSVEVEIRGLNKQGQEDSRFTDQIMFLGAWGRLTGWQHAIYC